MLWRERVARCLVGAVVAATVPLMVVSDLRSAVAATTEIEEIVVTARQREETLQDTPVAVTALSSNTIERLAPDQSGAGCGLRCRTCGSRTAPVVPVPRCSCVASAPDRGAPGSPRLSGIVIDGVHYERGRAIQQGYFDLEPDRGVEGSPGVVLRQEQPRRADHPANQGTRVTVLEANVKVGYEFEAEERLVEAGVSVPITDTLAVRLAGPLHRERRLDRKHVRAAGGRARRHGPAGCPGQRPDAAAARTSLRGSRPWWEPTDNFTALFKASYAENEDTGVVSTSGLERVFRRREPAHGRPSARGLACRRPTTTARRISRSPTATYQWASSTIRRARVSSQPSSATARTFTDYDAYSFSLQLDYELDLFTITSLTGFQALRG